MNIFCQNPGAFLAQDSEIHITGNATFANNSAKRDGGENQHRGIRFIHCINF